MTLKLSFGGCVFDDLDANGIVLLKDENGNFTNEDEPGLGGVVVRVVDANGHPVAFFNEAGEPVASTTTDSLGFYKVFGLTEGSEYKIQFDYGALSNSSSLSLSPANVVEPAFVGQGGSEGKDSDVTNRLSAAVVETDLVIAGSTASNKVNLGLIKPGDGPVDPGTAKLGNQVFEDANRNGRRDRGEIGIAGVGVTLSGAGADGIFGTGDDISQTTVTRSNGLYDFRNLDAGDYKVTFDQPEGFEFTQANVGPSEGNDSDANVDSGMTDIISLSVGERNFKVDAGVVRSGGGPIDPSDATLGNLVFEDVNGNGLKDSGEAGIAGVGITLSGAGADGIFGTGDDISLTTTTRQNGIYSFRNLAAGDYKVTFDQLEGFEFTQANVGTNEGRDSDADVNTGMTDVITLAESERNLKVDAGLVRTVAPNAAPNANDDSLTTAFNTPATINVVRNDNDPDSDPLQVTSIDGRSIAPGQSVDIGNGVVRLLDDGQLRFTADAGFSGDESFTYHVSDGNGGEDTATVFVTVAPAPNVAPNAANDSVTTDFNTPLSINVLGNDSDPDGDPLRVTSIDGQSVSVGQSVDVGNGTATLLNNGQISFASDAGFSGNESFTYHVSDGNGGEDTANVNVNVRQAPNNAPVHTGQGQFYLVTDAYRGGGNSNPGRELVVDLSRIVRDPDGDDLTYRLNFANRRREEGNSGQAGQLGYDVKSFNQDTGRLVFQIYTEYREDWEFDLQDGSDLGFFSFTATDSRGASKDASFRVRAYDDGPRTPLALDLNGDGVKTLSIEDGVRFDMLNTGEAVNTGWLSAEDGFLAVDNNGDGLITSRDELLGGASMGDGFAKLATFDSNGDGWVNQQDSAFNDLSIWQDANSNGITDAGELSTLASHGVTDLNTAYTDVFSPDAQGNILGEVSSARTAGGETIGLVDVYFQVAG